MAALSMPYVPGNDSVPSTVGTQRGRVDADDIAAQMPTPTMQASTATRFIRTW